MSSILFYSTRKSNILRKKNSKKLHTQKMDRVAHRGPLARAPGALKGGHFRNCQHFCRSWRGFVGKHQKIEKEKNFYFGKKISQCRNKTERGDPLGFSNVHSVAKEQKNWRGKTSGKKVSLCRKKLEGETLWSPRVWYGTRENRKNRFRSVR